jgi:hypothetical protein
MGSISDHPRRKVRKGFDVMDTRSPSFRLEPGTSSESLISLFPIVFAFPPIPLSRIITGPVWMSESGSQDIIPCLVQSIDYPIRTYGYHQGMSETLKIGNVLRVNGVCVPGFGVNRILDNKMIVIIYKYLTDYNIFFQKNSLFFSHIVYIVCSIGQVRSQLNTMWTAGKFTACCYHRCYPMVRSASQKTKENQCHYYRQRTQRID